MPRASSSSPSTTASGAPLRSARRNFPRPTVIRLTRFIHVPRRFRRQVTNTFLFARDDYQCQYCGRRANELKPRESLTRDHLIPMSRGGTNEWSNVVTACSSCNTRKANRMPAETRNYIATLAPVAERREAAEREGGEGGQGGEGKQA